jgi:hypothetical protein
MTCNFFEQSRVVIYLQQRIIVVGNGNIDVGKKTATGRADQPALNAGASERRSQQQQGGNCGAMSQQRGDSGRGHLSAPQKFVQLVGYRDPKSRDPKTLIKPVKR